MDDVVWARDAACETLADVEPARLRDALHTRLDAASMTPAVFALRVARALAPETSLDGVVTRAAGVQLIYEGLSLTRTLAHEEPWASDLDDAGNPAVETDLDGIPADLDILAADVFVSRGFYLLARTDAAERAVEVVRAFGRDQTARRDPDADRETLDRNLEADVFALAGDVGATAAERETTAALVDFAADLARGYDGDYPPVPEALPTDLDERVVGLVGEDRLPPSATDS